MFSAELTGLQSLGVSLAGFGGAFLLAQLARDAGKQGEKALFEMWGGIPSVTIFRHRDTRLDAITKARYHKKLAGLVKEAKAPTVEQEKADPASADLVYSAWSNYLRVSTRDTKKFGLLFHENVSYGSRRNVWGLRSFGIAVSLFSGIACGIRLYFTYQSSGILDETLVGGATLAAVLLLLWVFRFTSRWVRMSADAYAERLAESAEILGVKTTAAKDTGTTSG